MIKSYDVLIMGAGVAGCATAIALKNRQPALTVALVDRKAARDPSEKEYIQIGETLSAHAAQSLKSLGIWECFIAQDFDRSYGTSAAWGSPDLYHNEFIYSPYGYGWHLDRLAFDQMMVREATDRGVGLHWDTALTAYSFQDDHWYIKGRSSRKGVEFSAKIVVDATGHKAAFAITQGAQKLALDKLVGIYQFFERIGAEDQHLKGTYVESDEQGWWYSATLPHRQLVIAYMTDSDIAMKYKLKKPAHFNQRLQKTLHTCKRTPDTVSLCAPQLSPAHSQALDKKTGNKWLAVGDAAMSFDPLSATGIFKALSTSLYAAFAIEDELKSIPTGFLKYEKIMSRIFKGYCTQRMKHYGEEERFGHSTFWQRRQSNNKHFNHQQTKNQPKNETVKSL